MVSGGTDGGIYWWYLMVIYFGGICWWYILVISDGGI